MQKYVDKDSSFLPLPWWWEGGGVNSSENIVLARQYTRLYNP